MSAYCQVWGNFDYNKTPLAPLGTKLLVHLKTEVRETWVPRATRAWYLGPAMRHYRCYRVLIVETQAERIVDTVAWFPTYVSMSTPSLITTLLSAAYDLTQALLQPHESSPLPPLIVSQTRTLIKLAKIFKQSLILPTTERTYTIIEDDDENVENLLPNLHDDATVQTTNINEQNIDNTTEPPSPNVTTTNINTSLPRAPESYENICLPRVADRNDTNANKHTTYSHLTRNPGQRRRTAKKKQLSRKSFPRPNLERIEEDTILLSQPINQEISKNTTPSSNVITTDTTPYPTPSPPMSTLSTSSKTKNKSNVGEIGYKFKKFFPGHGYFQGEIVSINSVSTDNKNRRCRYTDGNMDDLSLKNLKQCPTATSTIYTPTRRSNRHTTKKNSINITVEKMNEI